MVFTREKMIRPIRIANDVFLVWEKWYMQSEAMEAFEFRAKIPAFYSHLWLAAPLQRCFANIQGEKFFSKSFSRKKVKNISEIWVE